MSSSAPSNDVILVTSAKTAAQPQSAYRIFVAWVLFSVVLFFLAELPVGRTFIYYLLVLLIVFILVTQYQAIRGLLAPLSGGKT